MNTDLNPAQIELIKETIVTQLNAILPDIIESIKSNIISKSKEVIEIHFKDNIDISYNKNINVEDIINKNRQSFNKLLDKREDLFYKNHRYNRLLDLYTECMESEELYIPRKFRNDDTHYMNQNESTVYRKLELQRFQAECEIYRIRRDNFKSDLKKLDEQISQTIKETTINIEQQTIIREQFDKYINQDVERISKRWDTKIDSLQLAFKKDKIEHYSNKNSKTNREYCDIPTSDNSKHSTETTPTLQNTPQNEIEENNTSNTNETSKNFLGQRKSTRKKPTQKS